MKRIMVMLMSTIILVGGLAGCGQTMTDMEMIEEICKNEGYTMISDVTLEERYYESNDESLDYYYFTVIDSNGDYREVSLPKDSLKIIVNGTTK